MFINEFIDVFTYLFTRLYESIFNVKRVRVSLKCLVGKTAIVTGGNSGIGFETSLLLASRGCRVIIADVENGEKSRDQIKSCTGNEDIIYKYLDLSSFKSVRSFASDINQTEEKIDFLINNAVIGVSRKLLSEDGLNHVMQVNIFGAFLLTHLLVGSMKKAKSARIIFVSSALATVNNLSSSTLNITDYTMTNEYIKRLYANSKACCILAAQEFGKRLEKYGITANSIDPMGAKTNIFALLEDFNNWIEMIAFKVLLKAFLQDLLDIANSFVYVITQNEPTKTNGRNYVMSNVARVPSILENKKFTADLFTRMEELVKLEPGEKIY